jgi:GntR family transcriptional regulator
MFIKQLEKTMKKSKTTSFLLDVDVKSAIPIYEQIKDAVKIAIFSQKLRADDKVISVRNLSVRHNINPLTILKAYGQLEADGFLYSRRGSGFFVRTDPEKTKTARHTVLKKEVAAFFKRISSLGFTLDDLQREITNYSEVNEDDQT